MITNNKFSNKKILLVSSDFVYPPNHGDRVDIWNRILCLNKLGFEIDLISTVKTSPSNEQIRIVKQYINKLILISRKNNLMDMLSIYPLQLQSRKDLINIKLTNIYNFIFLQGSYVFPIIRNKTLQYKHIILRMNNDESVYFKELANSEKIFWKKIYYTIESLKFKIMDKNLVRKIPTIFFVSHDEMIKYKKSYSFIQEYFMPTAIEPVFKIQSLDNKNVAFIGSLFMTNNKEAIEFYIKKVHPLLSNIRNYTLIIAGNSKGHGINWIKLLAKNFNNIKIYDTPDTLDEIYASSSIFINPMLHGAGVKLKTINAIVNGLPVVSTTIGNQGTGLENKKHIYIADDPIEYADCIKKLLMDKTERERLVNESQKYISLYYNQEKILSKYLSEIERS